MPLNRIQLAVTIVLALCVGIIVTNFYYQTSTKNEAVSDSSSLPASANTSQEVLLLKSLTTQQQKKINLLTLQVTRFSQQLESVQNKLHHLTEMMAPLKDNTQGEDYLTDGDNDEPTGSTENTIDWAIRRYGDEIRDVKWASTMEESIATEFSKNRDVNSVLMDTIDCRANFCRLVWQYPEKATSLELFELENNMLKAMMNAGFNTSIEHSSDGGGHEGYFWYTAPPDKGAISGRIKDLR